MGFIVHVSLGDILRGVASVLFLIGFFLMVRDANRPRVKK
jgi:hypothetical protein